MNTDSIPRLPTFPGKWTIEDPRARPYLVIWPPRHDETKIQFALRLEPAGDGKSVVYRYHYPTAAGTLSLVRRDRARGRRALFWTCPGCGGDRLYLYLVTVRRGPDGGGRAFLEAPRCSRCAGLRWRSQGDYRGRLIREVLAGRRFAFPRDAWDPVAVSDPRELEADFPGFVEIVRRAG